MPSISGSQMQRVRPTLTNVSKNRKSPITRAKLLSPPKPVSDSFCRLFTKA